MAPSVAIDIHPQNETDRDELAGQFAALLAAHAAEQKKLEDRVAMLEGLRLTETMVAAAASAAEAASSTAQSAAEAAQLVKSAGEAVETAGFAAVAAGAESSSGSGGSCGRSGTPTR